MTNDGRDFAKLTEKEVDGLSDPEFDRYGKWKKSKLIEVEQRLAENKEKLIEVEQRLAEAIALRIKAAKEADES